jgi:hypothetical protein
MPLTVQCTLQVAPEETIFLVGAYARYNWPYVWVSVSIPSDPALSVSLKLSFHTSSNDRCTVSSVSTSFRTRSAAYLSTWSSSNDRLRTSLEHQQVGEATKSLAWSSFHRSQNIHERKTTSRRSASQMQNRRCVSKLYHSQNTRPPNLAASLSLWHAQVGRLELTRLLVSAAPFPKSSNCR